MTEIDPNILAIEQEIDGALQGERPVVDEIPWTHGCGSIAVAAYTNHQTGEKAVFIAEVTRENGQVILPEQVADIHILCFNWREWIVFAEGGTESRVQLRAR